MKAIVFKSKIQNKQIRIPINVQAQLQENFDKDVKVIVLIDDLETEDDFSEITATEFFKGYADSDSIYDN